MKKLTLSTKQFMLSSLNKLIFEKIFELKEDAIEPVRQVYSVSRGELKDILWQEFNIPGMEVRIANTAFDWLIDRCEERAEDLAVTLRSEVKNVILHAAIFYTNVAPEAVTDRGWNSDQ